MKIKYLYQKLIRGFSDCELYNADITFIKFIYPRFKRYVEINVCINSMFESEEEMNLIHDKILRAFELVLTDEVSGETDLEVQEGLELFGKYLRTFWI